MTTTNINTDIHHLAKAIGTEFDYEVLSFPVLLRYFLNNGGRELCADRKISVIDPYKIRYINNHYQTQRKYRHWVYLLNHKERCTPTDVRSSNPLYFFNGEMAKHWPNAPLYYKYKDNYYLMEGEGNHRTIIAKYLWHLDSNTNPPPWFNYEQLLMHV